MTPGTWIRTRHGIRFELLAPTPEMVDERDLAFHLAHFNRFTGGAGTYSVAEHCCRVSWLLHDRQESARVQLAGLLHDAEEAYTGDASSPMRAAMRALGSDAFETIAAAVRSVVFDRFQVAVSAEEWARIKQADHVMLRTEFRDVMQASESDVDWCPPALATPITRMDPKLAEFSWLARLRQLCTDREPIGLGRPELPTLPDRG